MKLPIYKALIEEDVDGLYCISLVDEPAVDSDFQMFNKDKEEIKLSVQDEEKHLLTGVVMRCDYLIYRRDGEFEYYIKYDKETIEKMAKKMLKDDTYKSISLNHNGVQLPDGAVEMIEVFIKDTDKGISPKGFDEISDGSLFATFKVNDEEIWKQCKEGTFNGFSLEGYFTVKEEYKKIKKDTFMNKIKSLLTKMLEKMAEVKTDKGILVADGEIEVGVEVVDENGEVVADGEYIAEDETVYVVADGKISEIKVKEVVEEPVEEPVEVEVVEAEEVVEEPVEEVVEEPVEEYDAKAEIDALKAEMEELKEKLNELLSKPVAEPVEEAFEKHNKPAKGFEKYAEFGKALIK